MGEPGIKFLTLNCWGLKYLSAHREARLIAIADQLSSGEYDIIALQEVWTEKDWLELDRRCQDAYPFRRRFRSGVIAGPGLCVLLKLPIVSTFLYRFPINGRPSAFFRGDWYVGKGIGVTIIDPGWPTSPKLAVLNSHMHAPYSAEGDASYLAHRTCQAWDMAKFLGILKQAGYAVIQVGDLNSEPGSLPYRIFTQEGGLADSWEVLHGNNSLLSLKLSLMSPIDQVKVGGITCDSRLNTWHANKSQADGKRLDFALYDPNRLKPLNAEVRFTELLPPPHSCSFSDHFGYSVEFSLNDVPKLPCPTSTVEILEDIVREIDTYIEHTIPFQTNWRLIHFFVSLVLVILLQVAIAFAAKQAPWSSVVLSISSVLIAVTGFVNGLMCLITIPNERRNIEEVRLEVLDAKKALIRF